VVNLNGSDHGIRLEDGADERAAHEPFGPDERLNNPAVEASVTGTEFGPLRGVTLAFLHSGSRLRLSTYRLLIYKSVYHNFLLKLVRLCALKMD
jgi:hypothetical protein